MAIKLREDIEKRLLGSIKQFAAENMDAEIGDLKAALFLDFCVKEIGPSIYNQAIADAQAYFQEKTEEIGNVLYEAEFAYWKK